MPPTFAALHAPSPEAVPSTLPLTSSVAAALRSRSNRRASDCHPPPLGAFLPAHSGCPLPARGCFASHSPQPRSRALLPAAAVPPPCRPAPSRAAYEPLAAYVKPPPFLALGGAPMQPRLLAASASARFSPRPRVAASRPCRWVHMRLQPSAGQTRRQRVRNIHPPPLGACLPPFRDVPDLFGGVLPRAAPSPEAVPSSLRRRSSRFPYTSPTASPLQDLPQG